MTSPGRLARKTAVAVVGGATVATGIILMPLPGPGTLVAAGGLIILGTEFPAARRLVDRARKRLTEFGSRADGAQVSPSPGNSATSATDDG
jgi:uncharacterized protein (TIGR02611 family)